MSEPLRVLVTGAAGQIAYSLLFSIANGDVFGKSQAIILHLFDIPVMVTALNGVKLELEDCSLPLLRDVVVTDQEPVAFKDIDVAVFAGAMPRREGLALNNLVIDSH
jgi:malate dehydrogenase